MLDWRLFKSPLYILKRLQKESLRKAGTLLRGRLLDVGCGESPYRELCPNAEYIGLDRAPGRNTAVLGDGLDLPFKDGMLDGAVMTEVLEHVPVPEALIREVARVVRKQGLLYLTAPMTWCLHYAPNDYYRFTQYGLEFLLRQNGLEPVRVTRIGGVCSLIGVRMIDVVFEVIQKILFFLAPKYRERVGLVALLPFSWILYYLSLLLDRIDRRDALGWAILARKIA